MSVTSGEYEEKEREIKPDEEAQHGLLTEHQYSND
jgi:hypothetical protein